MLPAQAVFEIFAARDFAIGLLQPRFHNSGKEAADNVLTRARASRALGVFRGGNAPVSDGNHGNLLSQSMGPQSPHNCFCYLPATQTFSGDFVLQGDLGLRMITS